MSTPNWQPKRRRHTARIIVYNLVIIAYINTTYALGRFDRIGAVFTTGNPLTDTIQAGDLIAVDEVKVIQSPEVVKLIRENYGALTPQITNAITKVTFHYRSRTPSGAWITVYGRAYLPASPTSNLPVFAFAPGTTGIGDKCAASLEQPHIANWANYDSHLAAYAVQGMAVVTTDYEGMRDVARPHHYMVGELEGRALLDAVRALKELPVAQDRLNLTNLYTGGYSQGGHAALWADKIVSEYAPELKIKGVVGYGPVMSVKTTLADVTHGANINWFGPYVLYSYRDYYRTNYPLGEMLTPRVVTGLDTDVPNHCIDTNIPFWGRTPAGVYSPDFLRVLADNAWTGSQYEEFGRQLDLNAVGSVPTTSAKLINTGALDNVVLASQQTAGTTQLCATSSGPVRQVVYPKATHYDTMLQSYQDTLTWMRTLNIGEKPNPSCLP